MADRLYDLMNWRDIEEVVYAECDHPKKILGPRKVRGGILIQCFFPAGEEVMVKTREDGISYTMTMEDEAGFFALLLKGNTIPEYTYLVKNREGYKEYSDPYAFPLRITKQDEIRFSQGISADIHEKLGAHPCRVRQTNGVHFGVWAPNALRVSVVGDFNNWDGRRHPMERRESGIFEIFMPDLKPGELYKYEIKLRDGLTYLKSDPYAHENQRQVEHASIVANLSRYNWQDEEWMEFRRGIQRKDSPISIFECNPAAYCCQGEETVTIAKAADQIISHVKEYGYTHVELMRLMDHPMDGHPDGPTSSFFAPASILGEPADLMAFIDKLHRNGIGVLMDWAPASFCRGDQGLFAFDGTMLYEHLDPRQSTHGGNGSLLFNVGRHEVRNYLLSSAVFWIDYYHIDGLRMMDLAPWLYLDYGKACGQWIPNIYGNKENLEAISFIREMNAFLKKKRPQVLLIAEDSSSWPRVTASVKKDGLGFDYKWNHAWMEDYIAYFATPCGEREGIHNKLIDNMLYVYSENHIQALSWRSQRSGRLFERLGGKREDIMAEMRAALTAMFVSPGKKLISCGQDLASEEGDSLPFYKEQPEVFGHFMSQLLRFYRSHPALYEQDFSTHGFTWINAMDGERSVMSCTRQSKQETLLIVCNFSDYYYEKYQVGLTKAGKYKEIFNTDALAFGGLGRVNGRVKASRKDGADGRKDNLRMKLAPHTVAIFLYKES